MPTKKSAWTKEEDAVLREQVRLHGAQNWAAISEALALAGRRNPNSCHLRWCQHLSPAVDTAKPFAPQEDERIVALYRLYPNKWARTDNAVKSRWHSVLSKVYHHQRRRADAPIQLHRLSDGSSVSFGAGGCRLRRHHRPNASGATRRPGLI